MSGRFSSPSSISFGCCRPRVPYLWLALVGSLALHLAVLVIGDAILMDSYVFAVKKQEGATLVATVVVEKRAERAESAPLPPLEKALAVRQATDDHLLPVGESVPAEATPGAAEDSAASEDQPADADFFPSSELSVRPRPLSEVDIDTSSTDGNEGSGKVVLNLWINRFGEVVSVSVVSSDYPESFTQTIISGFQRLLFAPGMIGGRPVNSMMTIEATYDYPS